MYALVTATKPSRAALRLLALAATALLAVAANAQTVNNQKPWLLAGEVLQGSGINANQDFRTGDNGGTHLGRAKGWINELTGGETTGYWQTPEGPTDNDTRFLFVNRGSDNWSANEVRLVRAKPPVPGPDYDGYSLQVFPFLQDNPEHLTVSFPAIGVRQGEVSYRCPTPVVIDARGAVLLEVDVWVPDHRAELGNNQQQRPAVYASVDFTAGKRSLADGSEIRIPVDIGDFEQWRKIQVRVDWRAKIDKLWIEWRVWDPQGDLVVPKAASAHTRTSIDTERGVAPYNFEAPRYATPWSACAVLQQKGRKFQSLAAANRKVFPKIMLGSWLSSESAYRYYPAAGEAYFDNARLIPIRSATLQ